MLTSELTVDILLSCKEDTSVILSSAIFQSFIKFEILL